MTNEEEILDRIKKDNAISFNEIKLKHKQVGLFNNFMMLAIELTRLDEREKIRKILFQEVHTDEGCVMIVRELKELSGKEDG